jgi:hypothetical protein
VTRPHAKICRNDPLANRLIEARIRSWLKLCLAYADATAATEEERKGVHSAESHLDELWVELVPSIVDELKRAGLLKPNVERSDGRP